MLATARMTNPAFAVDGAMDALNAVNKAISRARLPIDRELVHLRARQINGCSVCVDVHADTARRARARHRADQRLEPAERRYAADRRRAELVRRARTKG